MFIFDLYKKSASDPSTPTSTPQSSEILKPNSVAQEIGNTMMSVLRDILNT